MDVFQFILVVAKCEDATEMVLKDMQTVSGYNPITITIIHRSVMASMLNSVSSGLKLLAKPRDATSLSLLLLMDGQHLFSDAHTTPGATFYTPDDA